MIATRRSAFRSGTMAECWFIVMLAAIKCKSSTHCVIEAYGIQVVTIARAFMLSLLNPRVMTMHTASITHGRFGILASIHAIRLPRPISRRANFLYLQN